MKALFVLLLLILAPSCFSNEIFSAKKLNKLVSITKTGEKYDIKTFDYQLSLIFKACAKSAFDRFENRLQTLFAKGISQKEGMPVQWDDKKKTISENSEFGRYINNLTQHAITLKREMDILCGK